MVAKSLVLATALRHRISEPNIEAGFARFQTLAGMGVGYQVFCDAVAVCLRERLIYEPIRLPEGALQCHWHLQLTPKGVTRARSLVMADGGRSSMSLAQQRKEVVDGRDKPGHDG